MAEMPTPNEVPPSAALHECPAKVSRFKSMFASQFPAVCLAGIHDESLKMHLGAMVACHMRPLSSKHMTPLIRAVREGTPSWGNAEVVCKGLVPMLLRNIGQNRSWFIALRTALVLEQLLWEGGATLLPTVRTLLPPGTALQDQIQSYDHSACGQGVKQRPVVKFAASMIDYLLVVSDTIRPEAILAVVRSGIKKTTVEEKKFDGTIGGSDCAAVLLKCAAVHSYLKFLLSARDLSVFAMDNGLSAEVLIRIVRHMTACYSFLAHHVNRALDLDRLFASYEMADEALAANIAELRLWRSLFAQFNATIPQVADFFDGIRTMNMVPEAAVPKISIPKEPLEARSQRSIDALEARRAKVRAHADENHLPRREGESGPSSSDLPMDADSPLSSVGLDMVDSFKDGTLTEPDSSNDDTPQPDGYSAFDNSEERYAIGGEIGRGAYGAVYRAFDNDSGEFVALKELPLSGSTSKTATSSGSSAESDESLQELTKEFDLLVRAKDPHVVSVHALDLSGATARIIMEWMPGGSIQAALKLTKNGFREPVVSRFMRQALMGLKYLHSLNIVHRDLKPGNMLLSATGEVKLSDFGTSRIMSGRTEKMNTGTVVGTIPYLAPECFKGTYSTGSDIWAIGCTALEMLTGRMPWAEHNLRDNLSLVFLIGNATPPNHAPKLPDVATLSGSMVSPLLPTTEGKAAGVPGLTSGTGRISMAAHDFLTKCFEFAYDARPSADQLLQHPFITAHSSP